MHEESKSTAKMLRRIFFNQFALSAFTGLLFYDLVFGHISGDFLEATGTVSRIYAILVSALVTGLFVALIHGSIQFRLFKKQAYREHLRRLYGDEKKHLRLELLVAFLSGSLVLPVLLFPRAVLALTVILLLLAIAHLRIFVRNIKRLMQPGQYARWSDVGEMLHVYLTMLAVFTMVMASMFVIHNLIPDLAPPLNLASEGTRFLDFVYFSVVVMTTLGFGDISPVTYDAKILVSLQCLVSYFMFALMIGLVTRGILTTGDDG